MPSLQDALQTAIQKQTQTVLHQTINEWSQDEQPQTQPQPQPQPKEQTMPNPNPIVNFAKHTDGKIRFTETVGVARAVFDHVLNNPGLTRAQITSALSADGYKKSSVQSLVGQNVRAGNFKKDSTGKIFAAHKSYTPVPSTKAQKRLPVIKPIRTKTIALVPPKAKTAGIAALAPANTPSGAFDTQSLLNTLSVMQARALYDELKKVFGG